LGAQPTKIGLFSRSISKLQLAKDKLKCTGEMEISLHAGDVTDANSIKKALNAFGPVDIFVAAAGLAIPKLIKDLTLGEFGKVMDINYMGVVNSAKAWLDHEADGLTNFCVVSSVAASVPFAGYGCYAPSKVAVRAFCDVLRNELAADKEKFVHIYFPPDMDTPGFKKENETKPAVCKQMWPEMFNEVFDPAKVADAMVQGLKASRKRNSAILKIKDDSHYHIESPDFFGNLLVSRAWGHYPRSGLLFFLEVLFAGLFVCIHRFMSSWTDGQMRTLGSEDKKKK
jgi:NADP-dependent 3-hydroxy acid dehydrogenase YdfG